MTCDATHFLLSTLTVLEEDGILNVEIQVPSRMTPEQVCAHLKVGATKKGTVQVFEDIYCTGGSELKIERQNRNVSKDSYLTAFLNPNVISSGGSILSANLAPPGYTPDFDLTLKRGSSTLIKVLSSQGENEITLYLRWSEH
jgi:hypothetical protein